MPLYGMTPAELARLTGASEESVRALCREWLKANPEARKFPSMQQTTTEKAPVVTLHTLVSVRIGSDQYKARVLSVTAATVTVQYGAALGRPRGTSTDYGNTLTFRPAQGQWRSKSHRLVLGESVTNLDPAF